MAAGTPPVSPKKRLGLLDPRPVEGFTRSFASTSTAESSRHEVRQPVPVMAPALDEEDHEAPSLDLDDYDDTEASTCNLTPALRTRLAAIDEKLRRIMMAQQQSTTGSGPALARLEEKLDQVLHLAKEKAADNADKAPSPRIRRSLTLKDVAEKIRGQKESHALPPVLSRGPSLSDIVSPSRSPRGGKMEEDTVQEIVQEMQLALQATRNNEIGESAGNKMAMQKSATHVLQDEYSKRASSRRFVDVWHFFEDEDSSCFARVYAKSMIPFILCTVLMSLLQAMDEPALLRSVAIQLVEVCIEALFVIEISARLLVARSLRDFVSDAYNIIDLASTTPLILRSQLGLQPFTSDGVCDVTCSILLGVVPVLRLLKLLRRFQNFQLLLRAFRLAFEAMPVLLFIWVLLGLAASAAIYVFEPRDNVPTLPAAIWLAVVSMTTLGYGDMYPVSTMGRFCVGALVLCTILYSAIPVGIIGSAFSEVWHDRFRILLTQRTRKRLHQAGYEARDIPYLFRIFDADKDGQVDLEEFKTMLQFMQVGFRGRRAVELFDLFDDDGSGGIDDREFVKGLFPENYHDIFQENEAEEEDEEDGLKCSGCGNMLMSEDKFCKKCGAARPDCGSGG